jgi:hypothetical protein
VVAGFRHTANISKILYEDGYDHVTGICPNKFNNKSNTSWFYEFNSNKPLISQRVFVSDIEKLLRDLNSLRLHITDLRANLHHLMSPRRSGWKSRCFGNYNMFLS